MPLPSDCKELLFLTFKVRLYMKSWIGYLFQTIFRLILTPKDLWTILWPVRIQIFWSHCNGCQLYNNRIKDVFKVNFAKVFDSLDWNFLLEILAARGLVQNDYIHMILKSTKTQILVNGTTQGYFRCKRGLRQGNPPSLYSHSRCF